MRNRKFSAGIENPPAEVFRNFSGGGHSGFLENGRGYRSYSIYRTAHPFRAKIYSKHVLDSVHPHIVVENKYINVVEHLQKEEHLFTLMQEMFYSSTCIKRCMLPKASCVVSITLLSRAIYVMPMKFGAVFQKQSLISSSTYRTGPDQ